MHEPEPQYSANMQVLPASQMTMGMPPSPTLTNPDMILPFDNHSSADSSPSTPRRPQQPPSPPMGEERHARSGSYEHQNRLKKSGQSLSPFRNGLLSREDDQARARSNSDRGRIKFENSKLSYVPNGDGSKGAAPTLREQQSGSSLDPLAESPEEVEDPIQDLYRTPSVLDEDENDPDSHAAMTRRAEEILANAKKRLNNMEGNLNRARITLASRPSSSMSSVVDREPVSLYSLQKERRANGGFSPLKHRQASSSLKEDHQGHSRVFSETAVPSSLQTTSQEGQLEGDSAGRDRSSEPARNWFWNGLNRSTSLADRHKKGLQPLNEDGPAPNSFTRQGIEEEGEDDAEDVTMGMNEPRPVPNAAAASHSNKAQKAGLSRARSTNQMRDLRDQVSDLKGKISTLKQRAREDSMRRRSLQSLRTPSPLNNADQDYSKVPLAEVPNRGTGLSPLAAIEQEPQSSLVVVQEADQRPATAPEARAPLQNGQKSLVTDNDSGIDVHDSPTQKQESVPIPEIPPESGSPPPSDSIEQSEFSQDSSQEESQKDLDAEPRTIPQQRSSQDVDKEMEMEPALNEVEDSLYDVQDYHETIGERHEDREDAFDYEHFFLHSSMGHYGRQRGSTHSSNYSQETERPSIMVPGDSPGGKDQSPGRHVRNNSYDSASSRATFATATEGDGKEEDEEWTPRQTMAGTWLVDPPVEQQVNGHHHIRSHSQKAGEFQRERSTKKHRREHSVTENGVTAPATDMPDLLTYLALVASKETGEAVEELRVSDSDKELAYRVIKSLAKVCGELTALDAEGGKYEARVCRRKLDTARRYLDGEVNGEAF